ncbi:cysteine hydrolase, partial [Klebsiella pneumoniae]|nr:cysteine hydrolase [Klebsiella pneumoniae]
VQTAFLAALGMFASVQNTADFLAKS